MLPAKALGPSAVSLGDVADCKRRSLRQPALGLISSETQRLALCRPAPDRDILRDYDRQGFSARCENFAATRGLGLGPANARSDFSRPGMVR